MATLKNIKCTYIVDVCQRTVILVHEKFYDGIVTRECCSQHRCHAILYSRKHGKIIQEGGGQVRTVISLQVVNTVFLKALTYWQQVKV